MIISKVRLQNRILLLKTKKTRPYSIDSWRKMTSTASLEHAAAHGLGKAEKHCRRSVQIRSNPLRLRIVNARTFGGARDFPNIWRSEKVFKEYFKWRKAKRTGVNITIILWAAFAPVDLCWTYWSMVQSVLRKSWA